jgi:hypothetical protein
LQNITFRNGFSRLDQKEKNKWYGILFTQTWENSATIKKKVDIQIEDN